MPKVRVFDIEANGLTPDKIHCMVFRSLDDKQVDMFRPHQMKEAISFMEGCDVLIGHNILSYDLPAIKKVLGYEYKGKKVDTLLMSRLQCPNRQAPLAARGDPKAMKSPHGLGCWGYRVGRGKPEHEDWETFSEEMLHRCSEDTGINVAVYHELMKEAEGLPWRNAHMLTFKLFENLQKQEEAGWLVDQEYMKRCIRMLDKWIERIDKVLAKKLPLICDILETKKDGEYNYVRKPFMKSGKYSASVEKHYDQESTGGHQGCVSDIAGPFTRIKYRSIDLGSAAEVKDWMLSQGWEPAEWNLDDDGNQRSPKMPKDGEFPGVEGKEGKLYAKRAKASHRRSNIEGWLKRVREDGRLAARVTGLADTRRAKHGNLVNVPNGEAFFGKQMRKGFIARDGWALVSADAANCQDRFLANRAGDEAFTKMLLEGKKEDGTDSHTLTQFAVNKVFKNHKIAEITRNKAKGYGFAFKFGASDTKLGKMANASKVIGEEIRNSIREQFPALAALIDKVTAEWRKNAKRRMNRWNKVEYYDGWIAGLDGAPVFVKSEHAVLVYAVQSDEAIYMSAVYNLVHRYLEHRFTPDKDYVVVAWIHDEISVECRDEIKHEVAALVEKAFTSASNYFKLSVPQIGQAAIGNSWFEVH